MAPGRDEVPLLRMPGSCPCPSLHFGSAAHPPQVAKGRCLYFRQTGSVAEDDALQDGRLPRKAPSLHPQSWVGARTGCVAGTSGCQEATVSKTIRAAVAELSHCPWDWLQIKTQNSFSVSEISRAPGLVCKPNMQPGSDLDGPSCICPARKQLWSGPSMLRNSLCRSCG